MTTRGVVLLAILVLAMAATTSARLLGADEGKLLPQATMLL